jgi:hypothetical protein
MKIGHGTAHGKRQDAVVFMVCSYVFARVGFAFHLAMCSLPDTSCCTTSVKTISFHAVDDEINQSFTCYGSADRKDS